MPRRIAALLGAIVATMALSGIVTASHAEGYTLFGDSQIVSPGNAGSQRAVQIRSDATISPGFGVVRFALAANTTFADLDVLSTDFMPQTDDLCLGGSPRFSIGIDSTGDGIRDGNIFVYFGPDSASPPCVPGVWQNTTDLLDPTKLVDTSQLGGTFYHAYPLALAAYGGFAVTSLSVVVDASWAHLDAEQTFFIDNTSVAGTIYTYERGHPGTRDDCKDGGWIDLSRDDGSTFMNQGDCIQYVNTGN